MSWMFGAGFGFLFVLPVLIGQWVGVIGLACGRSVAWWCMMIGILLTTLGSVLSAILLLALISNAGGSAGYGAIALSLSIGAAVSGLGSLLFVVGFAIHGLKSGRTQGRIDDLESVLAAQGEQLSRQQSGGVS